MVVWGGPRCSCRFLWVSGDLLARNDTAGFALQTVDAVLISAVILNWERTSFFITPSEIVIRRGVVELKEKVYTYGDIQSIELSQDVLGKILNYGSIYFYSQKTKEEIGITNIGRPHDCLEIIQKFKDSFGTRHPMI